MGESGESNQDYYLAVPKAELHVHLEGSIQPATLLELARRNGVDLPADSEAGLAEWFEFSDFGHFIQVYMTITRCLRAESDYELIAYEFGHEQARQNIRYSEVTFTPYTHKSMGVDEGVFLAGLARGRRRALEDFGVEINWVFDIVREPSLMPANADFTLGVAIDYREEGAIALGLGGAESSSPPEAYRDWFTRAREAGLHVAPHAGEHDGPESIWGSLRALGAERIGHGVRAIDDPELVQYLIEHGITLEINPTSNIRLGVYPSYGEHPMRRLHEAGVIVTVNSDDPPLFGTTMTREVELLETEFGLDREAIDEILLNGFRSSFLEPERRSELIKDARAEMARLREEDPA